MRRIGVWNHLADAVVLERLDRQTFVLQTWVRASRPTSAISLDFFSGLHGIERGMCLPLRAPFGIISSDGGRLQSLRKMARFGAENAIVRQRDRIFAF